MKKNIVIGSSIVAALIILASLASVVGVPHQDTTKVSSPLFTIRTQQAIEKTNNKGITGFLGKGTETNLFPLTTPTQEMVQNAFRLVRNNPALVSRLLENLDRFPALIKQLEHYGITTTQIRQYIQLIQDNPAILQQSIIDIQTPEEENNGPRPLGLSTSNPLGCFIVAAFALLPVTITLTLLLLLFTARILTCLNINDCANTLAKNIWEQLIQGLTEP